jgi:polar amino acid transport system substrate-binding protein
LKTKAVFFLLALLSVAALFPARASAAGTGVSSGARDYTYLRGKKIGVVTGTIYDEVAKDALNAEEVVYYAEQSSGMEDVRKGRIDGFILDLSILRVIMGAPGNEKWECLEIPPEYFEAPMGAISINQDIIDRFNAFLEVVKADGTLEDMQNRWLETIPDPDSPMPDIPSNGEGGVLRVAVCGTVLPFVYIGEGGSFKGYSVELVLRFAAREGLKAEFTDMDFGGLIPYVISGKADLAIANISITEERKKSVLFTDSIYDDLAAAAVLKEGGGDAAGNGGGFIEWFKTAVERNLIADSRWKMIVNGLGVTMIIALASQMLGTIAGGFICYLLTRRNRFAQRIAELYCGLIYGTPVVVLLMISYYIIFGDSGVSNIFVAVAAFAMVEGAIVAQNLKGAIGTINPVEIEAARSMGFTAAGAFLAVTLPQAVRRALPAYAYGFVDLVKSTAVVGYIAIQDLTRAGDIIRSRTYDAYFPLLFVALIYLAVTSVCVLIFKLAIKKVNGGDAE